MESQPSRSKRPSLSKVSRRIKSGFGFNYSSVILNYILFVTSKNSKITKNGFYSGAYSASMAKRNAEFVLFVRPSVTKRNNQ